jgi:hypothetical protein
MMSEMMSDDKTMNALHMGAMTQMALFELMVYVGEQNIETAFQHSTLIALAVGGVVYFRG